MQLRNFGKKPIGLIIGLSIKSNIFYIYIYALDMDALGVNIYMLWLFLKK